MGSSKTLGEYLAAQHQQRLSIVEVHRLWNAELHQAEGRTPYAFSHPDPTPQSGEVSPDPAALFKALNELTKIGKWQDTTGNIISDDQIDSDLAKLIQKGELQAYPGEDPSIHPIPVEKLQGVNLRSLTLKYYIDRDELGCFLFSQGHPLPAFWYQKADEALYKDRIAKQQASINEMREQLKAVIAENDKLHQELLNARPFMDPKHPFFAAELEAANAVWLELFGNKSGRDLVAYRPAIELWLEENRSQVLRAHGTGSGKSAMARIVTIVNPHKKPGRPSKKTTS